VDERVCAGEGALLGEAGLKSQRELRSAASTPLQVPEHCALQQCRKDFPRGNLT